MNILITGGAGFIGSHLAEKLLNQGHIVTIIDNLQTGRIENIEHLKDNKNFEYIIDTILNEELMKKLMQGKDFVFHLAAAVGVKYIIDNPLESIKVNVKGTEIILEYANKYKTKLFIASTSEIYGKNEKIPFAEEDDRILGTTTISRWSYSCTKAIDEFLSLAYYREKKLPVIIGRFFNICGPKQTGRYGMVIPRFVKQALMNRKISVYGTGEQTRCFLHVQDCVDALIKLMTCDKAIGNIYNIGNDERISIKELAERIRKATQSNSEIEVIPYEQAYEKGFEDMLHRQPNIEKIKKIIDFKINYKLDDIITDVVKYYTNS